MSATGQKRILGAPFLIERWCLLRIHCEDGTVGTGEAGVRDWPRPTATMIDEMKS